MAHLTSLQAENSEQDGVPSYLQAPVSRMLPPHPRDGRVAGGRLSLAAR